MYEAQNLDTDEHFNLEILFKSLLEFDGANPISMLAADPKSIESLLGANNKKYLKEDTEKFPLFYKNKIRKVNNPFNYYYKSAIDTALKQR